LILFFYFWFYFFTITQNFLQHSKRNMRPFPRTLLFAALFICLTPSLIAQTIFYVKPNGTGNGNSWVNASADLRQILLNAPKGSQVWVASGTYKPSTCTTCNDADRRVHFRMRDSVALYGGFVGTETQLSQRNLQSPPSVLSGNIGNQNLETDNSFNVLYTQNVGNQCIVDGFTVSNGYADDNLAAGEITNSGGGFFIDGRVDATASPTIRNCIFKDNYAKSFGGAVSNSGSFRGKCQSIFTNCVFENNRSGQEGGAVHNIGIFSGSCNPSFTFCQFRNNLAGQSGGAVFNDGISGRCEAQFRSCKFISNTTTTYGGGIYNNGKGGICNPYIENCLFWKNQAFSAGGVYCLGSERGDCSPKIYNCIFYANTATTGGAIYANGADTTGKSQPRITNCIIWANQAVTAPYIRAVFGTPILSYSIINTSACDSVYRDGVQGRGTCTEGVIYNQNPLFVDPQNGDFRLLPQSPAVDMGLDSIVTNSVDLDNQPRKRFNRIDIGAIEFDNIGFFIPKIEESPANRAVCARDVVTVRAKFSGTNPLFYQWYKNNELITGQTSDSIRFSSIGLVDSGVYRCVVRNNQNQTAQSVNMTLTVKPQLPLTVLILADAPANCEGDSVTMTARISNGGTRPRYDWRLNDASLGLPDTVTAVKVGYNSQFFRFKCLVRSSEQCAIPNPAESNVIQYNVLPVTNFSATMTASRNIKNMCPRDAVTFSTSVQGNILAPRYEWFRNGIALNASQATYTTDSLRNKDVISVRVTTNDLCPRPKTVLLRSDTVITGICATISEALASKVQLYPNPSLLPQFNLTGLENFKDDVTISVISMAGQVVFSQKTKAQIGQTNIELPKILRGVFWVKISDNQQIIYKKWVVANGF
jgi:Secretion system C-terminal sorting domain/Immunoglobulin domain